MKINNVTKKYGDKTIFENFTLEVEDNSIVSILGNSGCGKTTILNMISGLIDYKGTIEGVGKVSYIFQEERLVSSMTVWENIEFVLKNVVPKEEIQNLITEVLISVELLASADLYPHELSGGMAARVSLARAFAYPGTVLLMDEPFRSLDIGLKERLKKSFFALLESSKRTVFYVTHDIEEAQGISSRIIILSDSPVHLLYDEPTAGNNLLKQKEEIKKLLVI